MLLVFKTSVPSHGGRWVRLPFPSASSGLHDHGAPEKPLVFAQGSDFLIPRFGMVKARKFNEPDSPGVSLIFRGIRKSEARHSVPLLGPAPPGLGNSLDTIANITTTANPSTPHRM